MIPVIGREEKEKIGAACQTFLNIIETKLNFILLIFQDRYLNIL